MFLPFAEIPALIWRIIVEHNFDELKNFIPNLMNVDFWLFHDASDGVYILFVSSDRSGVLPTWGSNKDFIGELKSKRFCVLSSGQDVSDFSDTLFAQANFAHLKMAPGPVVAGRFPQGYSPEIRQEQYRLAQCAAEIIVEWAKRKKKEMDSRRIFLSHRGVNKPVVENIDDALRLIGLKTWLDKFDIPVGAPLLREIDGAFPSCCATVFFITSDYIDEGFIGLEIERARSEKLNRGSDFSIIPLVLRQHGGTDVNVPDFLRTLKWQTVDDIQIVPAIIRSIPESVQSQIKYTELR